MTYQLLTFPHIILSPFLSHITNYYLLYHLVNKPSSSTAFKIPKKNNQHDSLKSKSSLPKEEEAPKLPDKEMNSKSKTNAFSISN